MKSGRAGGSKFGRPTNKLGSRVIYQTKTGEMKFAKLKYENGMNGANHRLWLAFSDEGESLILSRLGCYKIYYRILTTPTYRLSEVEKEEESTFDQIGQFFEVSTVPIRFLDELYNDAVYDPFKEMQ